MMRTRVEGASSNTPVIECDRLRRIHPPATVALAQASFTVHSGQSVAVVGPSGSGKSTLLSLIGLLDRPSEGHLSILGHSVVDAGDRQRTALRRNHLGFIFQGFQLVSHLTARENVERGLRLQGVGQAEARERAGDALDRVLLGHRHNAMPGTMSGGEQQRIAIARAFARAPELLLCDEPTGNLDSRSAGTVMDLLESAMEDDGTTVVIVTHDQRVAQRCQRQLTVFDGVVSEGADFLTRSENMGRNSPHTTPLLTQLERGTEVSGP